MESALNLPMYGNPCFHREKRQGSGLTFLPQLNDTFKRFGKLLKQRQDLKQVFVLNGNKAFISCTGLRWKPLLRFRNRGLAVQFLKLIR